VAERIREGHARLGCGHRRSTPTFLPYLRLLLDDNHVPNPLFGGSRSTTVAEHTGGSQKFHTESTWKMRWLMQTRHLGLGKIHPVPRPRCLCYSPDRSSEQHPFPSHKFFPSVDPADCLLRQDDIVIFSAPTAYFLVADPHFGLSLLVTLSLTELINGIIKLYCIRPRPLWVSTALRRKGSVWEKVGT